MTTKVRSRRASSHGRVRLGLEELEPRNMLTGETIVTPYDTIPHFGAEPTIVSITSGNWSSASTWSLGRTPTAGDVVSVDAGTTVVYDVISDAHLETLVIEAGGHLDFRTDISTRVIVANFLVLEGGELVVGTEANPVAADQKAEIIFSNQALDTLTDPSQYGNGLIALGKVTMHGALKEDTFVRLATEPRAGDTTLTLSTPVSGWRSGDKLILPDSKQWAFASGAYVREGEDPTLASVSADGLTLTLTAPLQFNHPGARDGDGVLEFLPHVANRTRNVIVKSESASGVRGYAFFTHRAEVDIRYATFAGLGRSTNFAADNTTYDANGNVTHVGANQMGRFPVYFNHLIGPQATPANGHQFTFVGNAVFCPMNDHHFKWGVAINDSHYGLIQDNVLYNWAGSGMVTESGNESFNLIDHNFVARGTGIGGRAGMGDEGVAFWFRGFNNDIRNNVATNYYGTQAEAAYGYKFYAVFLGNIKVPNFQGADLSQAGQFTLRDGNAMRLLGFENNEAYGIENGLTIWWLNAVNDAPQNGGNSLIKDFRAWHYAMYGFYGYPLADVTFDGFVVRGDQAVLANQYEFGMGIYFNDYMAENLVIRHADIQNVRTGINDPYFSGSTTIIEDSYLRNTVDIAVTTIGAPGSAPFGPGRPPKSLIVRNVEFASTEGWNHGGLTPYAISMNYGTHGGSANLIASDTVYVYDYNGVSGDSFQVYYNQQDADFIVPQAQGNLAGSPLAGLTNQLNWDLFGIAIAGAVAPADATTRSEINGLVRLTAPPIVSSLGPVSPDPRNSAVSNVVVSFSEVLDAASFDLADLTLTRNGGANLINGSVTIAQLTATTFQIGNLAGLTATAGSYALTVNATGVEDQAGNAGIGSRSETWTVDLTAPTVTLNQAPGQADPAGVSPLNFAVVFSEAVTGFGPSDVLLGGTAPGTLSAIVTGSGTHYNVAVSGMTGSGIVTAVIVAGAALDSAGNVSQASTSGDNSVEFSVVTPNVSAQLVQFGSIATDLRLNLLGDALSNEILVELGVGGVKNKVRVSGVNGTTINGGTNSVEFVGVTKGILSQLLGGNDRVRVIGLNVAGPISLDGGQGDDTYLIASASTKFELRDVGGTDVLDFSGQSKLALVDLSLQSGQSQNIGNGNYAKIFAQLENVVGSPFSDTFKGNSAANLLIGGAGSDALYGREGNDTLLGGIGNDTLRGEAGNDVLDGGDGDDSLDGGLDTDLLRGGNGKDSLVDSYGNNVLLGGSGNDTLKVSSGFNVLIGGTGADTLYRSPKGNTILIGGTTSHDANDSALLAILAEWSRFEGGVAAPLSERISRLSTPNSGGLNGDRVLTFPGTVFDDGEADNLTTTFGTYYASTFRGNWIFKAATDKVSGLKPADVVQV